MTRVAESARSPGLWLVIGGAGTMLLIHLAEFLYPEYSVSENYISDLGIGPDLPRAVFTIAVLLFGLAAIVAALLLRKENRKSPLWLFLILAGVGALGVGVFNEDIPLAHRPSALLAFLFGNLAVLYSHRLVRVPASVLFAALGLIGLVALALYGAGVYLGIGVGGMERMILYPPMFWAIGYGSYLIAERGEA